MNQQNPKIPENIKALEEQMKRRYDERGRSNGHNGGPTVFEPPQDIYRSYEVPIFWKRVKKWLVLGCVLFGIYYFLLPAASSFPLQGKLIAREMRTIDAKTNGEIISLAKSNGDQVVVGEVIGRISNTLLHQEKKRLQAELQVLETELSGSGKSLQVQQDKLEVYKKHYEAGNLALLKLKEEEAKTEELVSQFEVNDAELNERKVRLANLDKQIEEEIITSPVSGIITSPIEERLNSYVKEGESICDVAFGGLIFEFRVGEEALRGIEIGQRVKIKLDAFPGKKIEGKVEDIRPVVLEDYPKPWLQDFNARILISSTAPLPKEARLGMSAKSQIALRQKRSRIFMWLQNLF